MKKYLIYITALLLLVGCGKNSPEPITQQLPQSWQDYQLRQSHSSPNDTTSEQLAETAPISNSESMEQMKQIISQLFTPDMSDYDKVFVIHHYLVSTVAYDYDNLQTDTLPDSDFTAEGALLDHRAVCEGYARAFSWLCEQAGLDELMISGTADNGSGSISHAWNQVKVDDIWYNIDVTWDDPLVEGQIVTDGSNIVYDYFLVPDSVIAENHWAEMPASRNLCTDDRYLASNRQLTIAPYLTEPYFFPSEDAEIQKLAYSCLNSDLSEFQLVFDAPDAEAQNKIDLVLNATQAAMEQLSLYGHISAKATYGIADYILVTVTISPD